MKFAIDIAMGYVVIGYGPTCSTTENKFQIQVNSIQCCKDKTNY